MLQITVSGTEAIFRGLHNFQNIIIFSYSQNDTVYAILNLSELILINRDLGYAVNDGDSYNNLKLAINHFEVTLAIQKAFPLNFTTNWNSGRNTFAVSSIIIENSGHVFNIFVDLVLPGILKKLGSGGILNSDYS